MKKLSISLLLMLSMLLSSISIINIETPVYAAKKPKKTTIIETSTDGCYNGFNVTLRWKKKSKMKKIQQA